MSDVSVSSRMSIAGSKPLTESACSTSSTIRSRSSCLPETLTETEKVWPSSVPRGTLSAGLLEHPGADGDDQSARFECRDEVVGLDDAAVGWRHRSSASTPVNASVCRSIVGW